MAIIEAKEVSYSYRSETNITPALSQVSLSIAAGEFVAVIGHNGSGKSTFARHINALILPDSGQVLVSGMDTKDEARVWDIRRTAGMVFQNPDNQLVATIVEEDVAFGPENLGVPARGDPAARPTRRWMRSAWASTRSERRTCSRAGRNSASPSRGCSR